MPALNVGAHVSLVPQGRGLMAQGVVQERLAEVHAGQYIPTGQLLEADPCMDSITHCGKVRAASI